MDIRLSKEYTEVLIRGQVHSCHENKGDDFKEHMYELTEGNPILLEALRLTAKKMKPLSYTFKDVKV